MSNITIIMWPLHIPLDTILFFGASLILTCDEHSTYVEYVLIMILLVTVIMLFSTHH